MSRLWSKKRAMNYNEINVKAENSPGKTRHYFMESSAGNITWQTHLPCVWLSSNVLILMSPPLFWDRWAWHLVYSRERTRPQFPTGGASFDMQAWMSQWHVMRQFIKTPPWHIKSWWYFQCINYFERQFASGKKEGIWLIEKSCSQKKDPQPGKWLLDTFQLSGSLLYSGFQITYHLKRRHLNMALDA